MTIMELNDGDLFEHSGNYYMKIDCIRPIPDMCAAVRIRTGKETVFGPYEQVTKVSKEEVFGV